jgi:hypothetical protein
MAMRLESTGRAAVAAGVLMTMGVEGEWLLDSQRDSGTITSTPGFALLVTLGTVGFALLVVAVHGLRHAALRRTRPARTGALLSLVGAWCLVVFGLASLGSGVANGSVAELSFLPFVLGMLLLAVGPVTWGLSLRRAHAAPGVWPALVISGVAAFGLLAIPVDPWHDVSMVVMFAAWSVLGWCVLRDHAKQAVRGRSAQQVG